MCPPVSGLKFPNAVTEHHPKARLEQSTWGMVTTLLPTLKVVAAHGELGKLGRSFSFSQV
jgi:hypothetical protein